MEPRTLILSSSMQPQSIATWQQSVVLLWQGKGEAIESYEATVSSPSITFQIPAVLRLHKAFSTHKSGVKFSRINVYTRDGFRCCYCNKRFATHDLNYDHVIPRSRGGKTTFANIVTSCKKDNLRKGSKTPAEAGMRMYFKPHTPKTLPLGQPLLLSLESVPDLWRPYLGLAPVEATMRAV
jgi:5-methylcytosine-specific restriction endonuclease McrA